MWELTWTEQSRPGAKKVKECNEAYKTEEDARTALKTMEENEGEGEGVYRSKFILVDPAGREVYNSEM